MSNAHVIHADCLAALRDMPDASVDVVVTDPPYGLSNTTPAQVTETITRWVSGDREYLPSARGFMGHEWDGFVPPVAVWDECLRVLKPGGHLLAFAGSRTQDLMGLAVRLAGFEIRDSVAWLHSQGFPKSHNVASSATFCGCTGVPCKNEAESGPEHKMPRLQYAHVPEAWGARGREREVLLQGLQESSPPPARREELPATEARREEPRLEGRRDVRPPQGELHRPQVCEVPGGMADDGTEGRVHHGAPAGHGPVDRQAAGPDGSGESHQPRPSGQSTGEPGAVPVERGPQAWRGWPVCSRCGKPSIPDGLGTALKPAHEPIILARKPIPSTVASNVLEHGTGAINVDACRIGTDEELRRPFGTPSDHVGQLRNLPRGELNTGSDKGRWPANVVLDESQAEELDRQSGNRPSRGGAAFSTGGYGFTVGLNRSDRREIGYGDSGGASRFFKVIEHDAPFMYCAKAPKSERPVVDGTAHPTVKPLALMRWLVRMVTPPNGTVLDPFAGSGTTLEAAMLEGFNVIGIEREADYLPLIHARIERATTTLAAQAEADADTLFPIAHADSPDPCP